MTAPAALALLASTRKVDVERFWGSGHLRDQLAWYGAMLRVAMLSHAETLETQLAFDAWMDRLGAE